MIFKIAVYALMWVVFPFSVFVGVWLKDEYMSNLSVFITWVIFFISLIGFIAVISKPEEFKDAKRPWLVTRIIGCAIYLFCLLSFAMNGYIVTTAVAFIAWVLVFITTSSVRELNKKGAQSPF